jgi:hypothetical protein
MNNNNSRTGYSSFSICSRVSPYPVQYEPASGNFFGVKTVETRNYLRVFSSVQICERNSSRLEGVGLTEMEMNTKETHEEG